MNQDTGHSHKTDFLGHDKIFPLLLKMGIPAAVAMLVNALYNIIDTIFVGQGVGPLAIAALSIVFPLQMIVSSIAQALSIGTASIVSRRLGEKKAHDAAVAIGTAYATITIVTATFVALVFIFMRPILSFFGASAGIMPYAMDYTRIVAIGFFFFALSMAASNLVRAEGNAKAAMTGMLIGALLNCVLDPLFIFAIPLGVKGAAIATIISQAVSATYLFLLYARKKTHVPILRSELRVNPGMLKESALLGIPAFVQSAGMSILVLIINTSLGFYGGDTAITTYGMINRLLTLIIFPILGIIQGFQPIAGYNYGAHRYDRVKASLATTILTVLGIAMVGYSIMMLFPRGCMALFTSDAELIKTSGGVLRKIALFIPLAAIQIAGSNYFQAIGKKIPSLILGLSRQFLILIPLVIVLPRVWGVVGIWYAFPLSDLLATTITTLLLIAELRHLTEKHSETTAMYRSA